MLFGEIAELCGQRNAIDGRLVEIVAELERDDLGGMTGARSMSALVAWKTGVAPRNAETMVAVAHCLADFPVCADGLRAATTSPPAVPPYKGPTGERAQWWGDPPFQLPPRPPSTN